MASLIVFVVFLLIVVITISRLPAVGPLFPRDTRHRLPGAATFRTSGRLSRPRRRGMPRAGLGREGKTSQLPVGLAPTLGVAGTLPGISGGCVILLVFLFAAATSGDTSADAAAAAIVMNGVIVVVLVHDERIQPGHVLGGVQGGTRMLLLLLAG